MMSSAGEVFLGVVKRRNSMITDAVSPASYASIEAIHTSNVLLKGPPPDYAMPPGSRPPGFAGLSGMVKVPPWGSGEGVPPGMVFVLFTGCSC